MFTGRTLAGGQNFKGGMIKRGRKEEEKKLKGYVNLNACVNRIIKGEKPHHLFAYSHCRAPETHSSSSVSGAAVVVVAL